MGENNTGENSDAKREHGGYDIFSGTNIGTGGNSPNAEGGIDNASGISGSDGIGVGGSGGGIGSGSDGGNDSVGGNGGNDAGSPCSGDENDNGSDGCPSNAIGGGKRGPGRPRKEQSGATRTRRKPDDSTSDRASIKPKFGNTKKRDVLLDTVIDGEKTARVVTALISNAHNLAASRWGDTWLLSKKEEDSLGESLANVLDVYAGQFAVKMTEGQLALIVLGIVATTIYVPRAVTTISNNKKKIKNAT